MTCPEETGGEEGRKGGGQVSKGWIQGSREKVVQGDEKCKGEAR